MKTLILYHLDRFKNAVCVVRRRLRVEEISALSNEPPYVVPSHAFAMNLLFFISRMCMSEFGRIEGFVTICNTT